MMKIKLILNQIVLVEKKKIVRDVFSPNKIYMNWTLILINYERNHLNNLAETKN